VQPQWHRSTSRQSAKRLPLNLNPSPHKFPSSNTTTTNPQSKLMQLHNQHLNSSNRSRNSSRNHHNRPPAT
jgi:hypothetical protein